MNASKETARKAQKFLAALQVNSAAESEHSRLKRFEYIDEFLESCVRKLPTEAAYDREKSRRRTA